MSNNINVININKELYKVSGIVIDRSDHMRSFSKYTYAVSKDKAISNIKYVIKKESGSGAMVRDIITEALNKSSYSNSNKSKSTKHKNNTLAADNTNKAQQLSLFA